MTESKDNEPDFKGKYFILPSRTLRLLGGNLASHQFESTGRQATLVEAGAYLWGVDNLELGKGIFNHSLIVGRYSWYLAKALKARSAELKDGKYTNETLSEELAAEAGVCHDAVKLRFGRAYLPQIALGIEDLNAEEKQELGYTPDIQEISPETDEELIAWFKRNDFPEQVSQAVAGHDFPEADEAIETIYQKILMVADYACGQNMGVVEDRISDIFQRWVINQAVNKDDFKEIAAMEILEQHWQELVFAESNPPRIDPERAAKSATIIKRAAEELFGYLGTTQEEFIRQYNPSDSNDQGPMPIWERSLRASQQADYEHQKAGGKGTPRSGRVKVNREKALERLRVIKEVCRV